MALEYEDKETGTVLKGFSQVDLDLLYRAIKTLTAVVGLLGTAGIVYIIWLTYLMVSW